MRIFCDWLLRYDIRTSTKLMGFTLIASSAVICSASEIGGGVSGADGATLFPSGKIVSELTCVMNIIDGDPAKGAEFGRAFEKVWNDLAQRGVTLPTKADREHFWTQILHESMKLKAMSEIGSGSSAVKGGSKYKGRGPIQLTHCYNYAGFARFVKAKDSGARSSDLFVNTTPQNSPCPPADLADHKIMTDPEGELGNSSKNRDNQALSAVWWWEDNKKRRSSFRSAVQSKNVEAVSVAVNGGYNGMRQRKSFYNRITKSGCVK